MAKVRRSGFWLAIGLLILVLGACLLYVILSPEKQGGRQFFGDSRIYDSSAGGDGTLYLVSKSKPYYNFDPDASISALAPDGAIKWNRPLSDLYRAGNHSRDQYLAEIIGTDEDSVYVRIDDCYAKNETPGPGDYATVLVAVSSTGELEWLFPLVTEDVFRGLSACSKVSCIDDRIYLNANITEYILDKQGNILAEVDLAPIATVGPDGSFYVKKASAAHVDALPDGGLSAGWTQSKIFQAYDRDGKLLWERNLSEYPVAFFGEAFFDGTGILTLHDGLLYVLLEDGIMALDTDGNTMWVWESPNATWINYYERRPFDSAGNVYLYLGNTSSARSLRYNTYDVYVISREGKLVRVYQEDDSKNVLARDGDILYYTPDIDADGAKAVIPKTVNSLSSLETVTICAFDASNKEDLWSVRLPVANVTTTIVTPDNVRQLFPDRIVSDIEMMNLFNHDYDNKLTPYHDVFNKTPVSILSLKEAGAQVSGDVIYVSLYTYSYETPTEYNKSRCAYASTLYAISRNGTLLWQKPATGKIYWMAAGNNSTIYYSTTDGRIFTTAMYVAGGITVAAILYTIAHFFGAGTVARARSRLDANENRNSVLKFIAGNPGSTMRDISRGLGMNLGTVRYHMLILSLNHKIASYQADGKHMRYFINSGAYTEEQQRIIAVVRRGGMRKVLESLIKQPGQSNKDLSVAIGMRESAISRYIGELSSAGLVEKTTTPAGGATYSINARLRESITYAFGRVTGKAIAEEVELNAPDSPEE